MNSSPTRISDELSKQLVNYMDDIIMATVMCKNMLNADGNPMKSKVFVKKIIEGIKDTCNEALTKMGTPASSFGGKPIFD